jgi:signal peptide peptidase SppA
MASLFSRPSVLPVVRLEGLIAARGGPAAPGLSLASIGPALEKAFAVKKAPAVALVINSPGGSAVQSSLIARRIRQLAEEKKKPVLAFVEDAAASGGYWLACAADEIIVDPTSIVGSIGVIGATFGLDRLIERFGVERRVYTAGRSKSQLDPFKPESPEEVARLRRLLEGMHQEFITHVTTRRAARLQADHPGLFEGEVYLGREAVALGLADAVGDLHTLARARFGEKVKLKTFAARKTPTLARLLGAGGDALAAGMLAQLEERAAWARVGV